jgi:hypothetical protein
LCHDFLEVILIHLGHNHDPNFQQHNNSQSYGVLKGTETGIRHITLHTLGHTNRYQYKRYKIIGPHQEIRVRPVTEAPFQKGLRQKGLDKISLRQESLVTKWPRQECV